MSSTRSQPDFRTDEVQAVLNSLLENTVDGKFWCSAINDMDSKDVSEEKEIHIGSNVSNRIRPSYEWLAKEAVLQNSDCVLAAYLLLNLQEIVCECFLGCSSYQYLEYWLGHVMWVW